MILDAALGLIAREGFASITHRRVAVAADVPLGSTTYYFDSRDHLLREAFLAYLSQTTRALREAGEELAAHPTRNRLIDFLVTRTLEEVDDGEVLAIEYELVLFAARDGSLATELHAWLDALVARLAEVLETLGAAPPFEAARTVLHLVRGFELDQLTRETPDPATLRRRLDHVLDAYGVRRD